jgi:cytokinin dehydrogenase
MTSSDMTDRQGWFEDAPQFRGALRFDDATLRWAAEDFGHIVRHRPVAVLRPASVSDIAAMLSYARSKGLLVAARGQGHGTLGHAQAPGGVVIDMSSLCAIHGVEYGVVVVDAGARWSEVLAATLPLGLTPPVLTDYLELSVGGTLSVGGLGGMSHRHGAQTDCVNALEVVTPEGEITTCSRTENTHLFDAVRAGKGGSGIITKATLALNPAPRKVRRYKLACADSDALISNQIRLLAEGRFDHLEGQVRPEEEGTGWQYVLEAVVYYTPPSRPDDRALLADLDWMPGREEIEDLSYASFLARMAPGEEYLRSVGAWFHPHPWCNLLLPAESVRTVFAETMRDLTHADIGKGGLVLVYPIPRALLATPRLSRPQGELAFLFALLRTAPPDDPATLARMQHANRLLTERALTLGGTTYLA